MEMDFGKMLITKQHREKLIFYLREFYKHYPQENFTIFHFVKFFKARLDNELDAWLSCSGNTGSGKSLFVIMSQILYGKRYSLIDNVTYLPTGNEIVEKFEKLKKSTLLIDEAVKDMRAVDWQKKSQQKVNVTAWTERYRNNWVFLNIPNFNELTKSMRTGSVLFRCIVLYRTKTYARIVLQRKSRNWRSDDPWGDTLANQMYEDAIKKYKELDNDIILSIERKMPNTIMDFIIPNLELILPDVTDEYKRLKVASREDKPEEVLADSKDRWKTKYQQSMESFANILFNNTLDLGKRKPSMVEMATALGMSVLTFRKYLERSKKNTLLHTKVAQLHDSSDSDIVI